MHRPTHTPRVGLSLLFLLLAVIARADDAEQKVDAYVRSEMEKRGIPGLSIAVVKEGNPILTKGYGKANLETDALATADTVYQLASVSKQFTATAIMLLAEDGKLSLDDKVSKFLPEAPTAWEGVTIRHLLNHTSGIKSYTSVPSFLANSAKPYTQAEMLKLIYEQPMEFQPGEKWNYNNSGFYLLGVIIEKASGKDYDAFLQERIFKPLSMTSTRLNTKAQIIKGRAVGYSRNGKEVSNAEYTDPSQPFSAGALISTVKDMAKWDAALYSDKILKKSALDQMWTITKLKDGKTQDYGYGWSVGKINGHREIGHGGGITGFSTYIGRFVDDKLSVIVLTNLDSGNAQILSKGIAACYLPDLAPKPAVVAADKDPEATELLRKVIRNTIEGKDNTAFYTPELRTHITPELEQQATQALKSFGELKSIAPQEQEKNGDVRRYKYRVTFENLTLLCNLALNKENKLTGLNFMPE